jgi:hypothetical protein
MTTNQNENAGAMFKNMDKRGPTSPDYNGSVTIDGVEYWVSGWIKTAGQLAKNPGMKFLSLAFNPKEISRERLPVASEFDDDIPF